MRESPPTLTDRLVISDEVVARTVDNQVVILNLETGIYFGLDEVGTRAWSLIAEHGALQAVFAAMQAEYDVTTQQLESDLLRLVSELAGKGLVRIAPAGASAVRP